MPVSLMVNPTEFRAGSCFEVGSGAESEGMDTSEIGNETQRDI